MEHYSTQEYVGRNVAFLVILGGLLASLGAISAVSPLAAGLPITIVLGVMFLARGSMQLYYGVKVRHWGHSIGAYMGLGSIVMSFVSVACAVVIFTTSRWELELLITVLAGYLVLLGGTDLVHAVELRSVDGWFVMFLNGLASVAFGVMVWLQWPLAGAWAMGGMMGLSMIFAGISLALLGASGRPYLVSKNERSPAAQLE